MTVVSVAVIDCVESTDSNDVVAAFINGEVRGVQKVNVEVGSRWYAYMIIYDNDFNGNTITFQVYDASADSVYNALDSLVFEENDNVGDFDDPYVVRTDICVSTAEKTYAHAVRFFPNPATHTLFFKGESPMDFLRIYGLDGRLVYEAAHAPASVDVSGWSPQVYWVWWMTDGVVHTERLVVQR
jgi:hypothetical protein